MSLCNPMDYSMLGFPVHHQLLSLLKLMSIESVIPSNWKHEWMSHLGLKNSYAQSFQESAHGKMTMRAVTTT